MQNTWSLHHTHDVQRLAETDQGRLLQACRDILGGPDTPGRRWLIRQAHGDSTPHGVESVGAAISSLPVLGFGRIRDRLRAEFPSVLCGRDVLGRKPVDQGSARKDAEACILPDLIGPKTGKTVLGTKHISVEGLGEQNPTNAVDERPQGPPVDDRANMGIPGPGHPGGMGVSGPILSIDPGSKRTGWAVSTERERLLQVGVPGVTRAPMMLSHWGAVVERAGDRAVLNGDSCMILYPQKTGFVEPPRPTKTLADIRRSSELCWRASLILIWEWIEATIPGTVCGLAGEGKLEAIERLYDQGYLRFHRTDPTPNARYRLWAEAWDGKCYQRIGKGPNGSRN